jgi:hypothetical protein
MTTPNYDTQKSKIKYLYNQDIEQKLQVEGVQDINIIQGVLNYNKNIFKYAVMRASPDFSGGINRLDKTLLNEFPLNFLANAKVVILFYAETVYSEFINSSDLQVFNAEHYFTKINNTPYLNTRISASFAHDGTILPFFCDIDLYIINGSEANVLRNSET